MKKLYLVFLLVGVSAYAQTVDPTMPDWINGVLKFIEQFSWGGEFIVKALKILGFMAALLTFVTALVDALSVFLKKIGQVKFLSSLQKLAAILDKIRPWLAYFSMYNIQKK